jgi:hypothetical protein
LKDSVSLKVCPSFSFLSEGALSLAISSRSILVLDYVSYEAEFRIGYSHF